MKVVNIKAYSTYDLWSQIGGVVGIFLGVSILQVIISESTLLNQSICLSHILVIDTTFLFVATRNYTPVCSAYQGENDETKIWRWKEWRIKDR